MSKRRHRRLRARARNRFGVRRQQLAEDLWVPGGMGLWPRDLERKAPVPRLRDALHGDVGHSRPENTTRELSDDEQETPGRRGESCHTADRLLHTKSERG